MVRREAVGLRSAVAVFAYERPHYLKECAAALDRALQRAETPFDVYLFLDGGEKAQQSACIDVFRAALSVSWRVQCNRENEGPQHLLCKLDQLFQEERYDRVVLIEEDAVLAPNALVFVDRSFAWLRQMRYAYCHAVPQGWVGAVSLWFACQLRPDQKPQYARDLCISTSNLFAYYLWRDTWELLWPHLSVYRTHYKGENMLHAAAYRRWLFEHRKPVRGRLPGLESMGGRATDAMASAPFALSQDAFIATSLCHEGLVYLAPTVNRCINIGKIGLHSPTEDVWAQFQWDSITCDEVEEPSVYELRRFPAEAVIPPSAQLSSSADAAG